MFHMVVNDHNRSQRVKFNYSRTRSDHVHNQEQKSCILRKCVNRLCVNLLYSVSGGADESVVHIITEYLKPAKRTCKQMRLDNIARVTHCDLCQNWGLKSQRNTS